jgi:conjugal transfer pilin signal peptidase TrbI
VNLEKFPQIQSYPYTGQTMEEGNLGNFINKTIDGFFWFIYDFSNKRWVFWPLATALTLYLSVSFFYSLGVNLTSSLPQKYYLIEKQFDRDQLQSGDIIQFKYKDNFGFKFNSNFLKVIAGKEGDVVRHIGRDVYVNDKHIGFAKLFAGREQEGDALEIGPEGAIPKDHFFVYTANPDSFDSRYKYVGLVRKDFITGRAIAGFGANNLQN